MTSVSPMQVKKLHESLLQEVGAASEEAILSDGQVSTERLERLERLARLTDLCRAVQPTRHRRRWPMFIALVGTLIMVSLLLFARVSETEIELELTVSELGFNSVVPQVLAEDVQLASLGLSGLQAIRMPRTRDQAAHTHHASEDVASTLKVFIAPASKEAGTVTLSALMLPAGAYARIRQARLPHQYRLSLEGVETELRATVDGQIHVRLAGEPPEAFDLPSPKAIRLQTGADEFDLDLAFVGVPYEGLLSQLLVEDLSFFRVDEFVEGEQTLVHHASTILSGTLYLESLNGRKHVLRPYERLHFAASRGEIRTLRVERNDIVLQFHGQVRGMGVGSIDTPRSLMPTYLEWLQARQPLSLLWGTTLYLFGLVAGVYRWWSKPI